MLSKKLLAGLIFGSALAQEVVEEPVEEPATEVSKDHIGGGCITKGSLVGATASTNTAFDQSAFVYDKFDKDQYPTYKRECRESPGADSLLRLVSF